MDILREYGYLFQQGAITTVELTALSVFFSLIGGSVVGALRCYGGRVVSAVLGVPVDIFRSIPLLVVLIWIFFAAPAAVGMTYISPFQASVVGLSLTEGAYISEIVRGGLLSVRSSQVRAALALGMTRRKAIIYVVMPQALVRMLPPIGSQILLTFKDSTLASVIATPELLRQSQIVVGETFKPFQILSAVMVAYFVVGLLIARLVDRGYDHLAPRGSS